MPWYEIVIPKNDVANESAARIMDSCARALLESAIHRRSVQTYHGRNDSKERVFYFYFPAPPPELLTRALVEFGGSPCPQPELKHFTEIKFP